MGKDWNSILNEECVINGVATLKCIPAVFQNIVIAALTFVGLVAIVLIIFSGIKFIISHGDAKQIEGAKSTLTYAIIGLFIVLLAFLIINIISFVTGVQCIRFFGFDNCQ